MLILSSPDFEGRLTDISPWFDAELESLDVCVANLEAQQHRRFIKTHTPLDGIPYYAWGTYLVVYRVPRDVYFSIRNHLLNMREPPDIAQLAPDPRDGFRAWLNESFRPGVGEQRSLEAVVYHYTSFKRFGHLSNMHFFHYADMQRSLGEAVARIASLLALELTEEKLEALCQNLSFSSMKKNAGVFAPAAGKPYFKSDSSFFSSGQNRQWQEVLGPDDIGCYQTRSRSLLPESDLHWLENGGTRGPL